MKADISITKSRKGTEIVVSGKRINKYGIIAAIVFAVPMLILFQSIHGETTSHLSLVRFFMCILAAVLVNLFLHNCCSDCFRRYACGNIAPHALLPFLLLGILPLIYGMTSGNYDVTRFGILLAVMSFDDLYILWQLRSFGGGSYITDKSEGLNFHVW